MQKTYLVELLKKLSSKQMKELSEFVQSPFFNKNNSVIQLFEYLRTQHPEFEAERIEKEKVHQILFPSAEYNDSFMRTLIFKLATLAEQYIAFENFRSAPYDEPRHLINTLLDLNLDGEAQKQINQVEKKLDSEKIFSKEYYKNRYEIEKLKDIIYSRTYRAVTVKDKPDESLLEESNNLTAFFIISILQRYRYLLNKSYTVNTEFNLDFLPYIVQFLEKEGRGYLKNLTILVLYKQILLLLDNSREDLLDEIIKMLTNDKLLIEDEERREGLTVTGNICIEKGYEGKDEFSRKLFHIDRYLVNKNLYNRVKGGYFENAMFLNLVTLGLKLEETEWVKNFIEENYKKLSPDYISNTYNYCYSKVYFKTRDFQKALEYISKASYTDLHMKINVRITGLTILYELNNIEEVFTQLENFKKYVQNDKLLSPGHRKISTNFIKFTGAICKAKYSPKANLEELRKEIEAVDQVPNRIWLLRKLDEIAALRK